MVRLGLVGETELAAVTVKSDPPAASAAARSVPAVLPAAPVPIATIPAAPPLETLVSAVPSPLVVDDILKVALLAITTPVVPIAAPHVVGAMTLFGFT